jgi:hypothetical protein
MSRAARKSGFKDKRLRDAFCRGCKYRVMEKDKESKFGFRGYCSRNGYIFEELFSMPDWCPLGAKEEK